MKKNKSWLVLLFLLTALIFNPGTAFCQDAKDLEVGITEHLDKYVPNDIMLTNQDGKSVNLKQLINKPTVLCFVYYRCPGICSPLMNGLAEVISKTDLTLGKDFQAITISFDSRETFDLAQKKKVNYIKRIKGQDGNAWTFMTGDSLNIVKATKALGFGYKFINNQFLHEAALIMISPEGKITRYLKGIDFQPFEFKMAIVEASQGKSAPTLIKVLQYCYSYDRKTEHYSLDVTRITATLTLIFAVSLLIYLLIRGRRKKSKSANS